jgi:hypothetical protein
MGIDKLLEAIPEPRRTKVRQRILAIIQDSDSRDRADWSKVTKMKDAKHKKRNGVART